MQEKFVDDKPACSLLKGFQHMLGLESIPLNCHDKKSGPYYKHEFDLRQRRELQKLSIIR